MAQRILGQIAGAFKLECTSYSNPKAVTRGNSPASCADNCIPIQGPTIIEGEHHTRENILSEIEHAVSYNADFHPFVLYTPAPGTPLYQRMVEEEPRAARHRLRRCAWPIQI
jgi:hypothetical protein